MVNVLMIGAGSGGSAILDRLLQYDVVTILGIADLNPDAPGLIRAAQAGIPVFSGDGLDALKTCPADLVFDLTGDPEVQKQLYTYPNRPFNVISGDSILLFFNMIQQLEEKEREAKTNAEKHRILSEISLAFSHSKSCNEIFDAIVSGAMHLTGMPAGSLSIYHSGQQELFLVSAKGFSTEFFQNTTYKVRKGGLTEQILAQTDPILISRISEHPEYNNPVLSREGVQSLIAVPLISEKGPVGILYVDDFKPNSFSPSAIEILKLLALQATIAIQKQQAFEQIKALAIRDPVTGLYNRRYLSEILPPEMDRAGRLDRPLSVILFDIDHFKGINDRYGHLIGDQVLLDLVKLFELKIRRYDTFCRFGGDEFLILLTDTTESGAREIANRMLAATASAKILPDKNSLTCSFGVYSLNSFESGAISPDLFFHRADQALFEAKRLGRNRIFTFSAAMVSAEGNGWEKELRTPVTRSKNRRS